MYSAVSYELATTRIVDLHRQAKGDALARTTAHPPSSTPQPRRNRLTVRRRRSGRQRRLGTQVWTLLHAQALLDGSDTHPYQR